MPAMAQGVDSQPTVELIFYKGINYRWDIEMRDLLLCQKMGWELCNLRLADGGRPRFAWSHRADVESRLLLTWPPACH